MREPAVVAVAGSCVTRDNFNSRFNPGYKRFFTVELSSNQTSMITLMSEPIEPVFEPVGVMTDYDRWNVQSDLSREFLGQLVDLRPDYLILDFFGDVHFGVLRQTDGRYLTDNPWKLWRTDYYQERERAGDFTRIRWSDDEDAYVALWAEAMDRFAAYVAEHCPETTVIVHYGYNTDTVMLPGESAPKRLRKHVRLAPFDVPRANAFWSRLDDLAIERFGWETIDLRSEQCSSYAEHPWGPFYVHYTLDYYHRFLAELHKIHLRRTASPELTDRIAEIEDAARERSATRAAVSEAIVIRQKERIDRMRARLERKDQRIDQLESLGVFRAASFAVRQRLRRSRDAFLRSRD